MEASHWHLARLAVRQPLGFEGSCGDWIFQVRNRHIVFLDDNMVSWTALTLKYVGFELSHKLTSTCGLAKSKSPNIVSEFDAEGDVV